MEASRAKRGTGYRINIRRAGEHVRHVLSVAAIIAAIRDAMAYGWARF